MIDDHDRREWVNVSSGTVSPGLSRTKYRELEKGKGFVFMWCSVRAGSVTSIAVNLAYLLSILISPYMPTVSTTIQSQLGVSEDQSVLGGSFVQFLPEGHEIGKVCNCRSMPGVGCCLCVICHRCLRELELDIE